MKILCVGNDQFNDPNVPDLKGCIADANLMKELFSLLKHTVDVQVNVQKEAILARMQKEKYDLIYWSGHGSYINGPNGTHYDGLVCASDGHKGAELLFLYDLSSVVDTTKTFIILDTCFSGGIVDMMKLKAQKPQRMRFASHFATQTMRASAVEAKPFDTYACACTNKQSSYEGDFLMSSHGFFTWSFVNSAFEMNLSEDSLRAKLATFIPRVQQTPVFKQFVPLIKGLESV